jgi:hypothetical protein
MTPLFPRSGPGESGSPMSAVILRCYDFPARIPGHLFVSLPGSTFFAEVSICSCRACRHCDGSKRRISPVPMVRCVGRPEKGPPKLVSSASIDEFDGSARADELGKWRSSSTWCRQETRRATRNSSCISGSTKYDRRAYRSSARTFRGRPAHYCIERIPSRSWNDDWKRSSSS